MDESNRTNNFIYGIRPDGMGLVFIEEEKLYDLVAWRPANTWGELRRRAPKLYIDALQVIDRVDNPPFDDAVVIKIEIDGDGEFPSFPDQDMIRNRIR